MSTNAANSINWFKYDVTLMMKKKNDNLYYHEFEAELSQSTKDGVVDIVKSIYGGTHGGADIDRDGDIDTFDLYEHMRLEDKKDGIVYGNRNSLSLSDQQRSINAAQVAADDVIRDAVDANSDAITEHGKILDENSKAITDHNARLEVCEGEINKLFAGSVPLLKTGSKYVNTAFTDYIKAAQVSLGLADDTDSADGIYGPATEKAVRAFQQEHGLTVDGKIGRQTWTAMVKEDSSLLASLKEAKN